MRGVVRYETDNLDQAFDDLDAALRLDPKSVSALIERASLWQWRNRLDKAVADVSKAIELDPKNSFAYVERGVFEYNMKKYDECLGRFQAGDRPGFQGGGDPRLPGNDPPCEKGSGQGEGGIRERPSNRPEACRRLCWTRLDPSAEVGDVQGFDGSRRGCAGGPSQSRFTRESG